MPDERTEATEIATALGMLGFESLIAAVDARPSELVNVSFATWDRLTEVIGSGRHQSPAHAAFENGVAFVDAADGLRGRRPVRIEWKGPQRPPGYDLLPADLRIDHVFLVSCKYQSRLLMNAAPAHLFDRALQIRNADPAVDWYALVAPEAYEAFYESVRSTLGSWLPAHSDSLTRQDRERIGRECARHWPSELELPYTNFSDEIARATAARWSNSMRSAREREFLLWRMLRFSDCPYFILGTGPHQSLRLRIATPWDWRQSFRLIAFQLSTQPSGQPRVEWEASVTELESGYERHVQGHVEIRWSHGRFCGMPEAKIYLDTPHEQVPGYFPLEAPRLQRLARATSTTDLGPGAEQCVTAES